VLQHSTPERLAHALVEEARCIHQEELAASAAISTYGASLVPINATVLTHCNAGMIATASHGTALGAIVEAYRHGRVARVIATETRPLLQGARLTIWELVKHGVPATLITDSMVCHVMRTTHVDCVMVGADRIAANGDVANKIGTSGIATLARAHRIPFYVAAPTSTVDLAVRDGEGITIEQRNPDEVTSFAGRRLAARGSDVLNPAFDVTPHRHVSAIVTERGIISAPYTRKLRECAGRAGGRRK
jgi:methylthioribose-1-phosphate isomerase